MQASHICCIIHCYCVFESVYESVWMCKDGANKKKNRVTAAWMMVFNFYECLTFLYCNRGQIVNACPNKVGLIVWGSNRDGGQVEKSAGHILYFYEIWARQTQDVWEVYERNLWNIHTYNLWWPARNALEYGWSFTLICTSMHRNVYLSNIYIRYLSQRAMYRKIL